MFLAVGLLLVSMCAGLGVLRALHLPQGFISVGLAPAAGLAVLSTLATWTTLLGAPPFISAMAVYAAAASGLVLELRGRTTRGFGPVLRGEDRPVWLLLGLALVVPMAVLWPSMGNLDVPLTTHDGAHHVETIQTLRDGLSWQGWYPPGYHALMAALLWPFGWVDSAAWTTQASLGLTLLGQLAAFGLGCAVWGRPVAAAAGAVLLGLTYHFPYTVHGWGLWPMVLGMILVLGLWTIALRYVEEPRTSWALLGGLLAGAVGLVHTVEVYTTLIGLLFVLVAYGQGLRAGLLARHLAVALLTALVLVVPYVPALLGWASTGGAVAVGEATTMSVGTRMGIPDDLTLWLDLFSAVQFDSPVRVVLLGLGTAYALRRPAGRAMLGVALAFLGITLAFVYLEQPTVRSLFALTFPWSHGYRLLMVSSLVISVVAGAGLVEAWRFLAARRHAAGVGGRLVARAGIVVLLSTAIAVLVLAPRRLAADAAHYTAYSPDDRAALDWLRGAARPGDVLVNDWASDAGIWAPYKSGVAILLPRLDHRPGRQVRTLIGEHVAELEWAPEAREAACTLGVRWVYYGAVETGFYEPRRFPPLAALRASSSLEEVYTSGQAAVFRTKLDCGRL